MQLRQRMGVKLNGIINNRIMKKAYRYRVLVYIWWPHMCCGCCLS